MACLFYSREKSKNMLQHAKPTPSPILSDRRDESAQKANNSSSSVAAISPRSIPELYEEHAHELRSFCLAELRNATGNFSRELKIGEGGFGCVYKGLLKTSPKGKDSVAVAVKRLNPNGMQGHKQWLAEVQFLAVVEHTNLVRLLGYCATDDDDEHCTQRLLVYEFMASKTLDDHLFNKAYPSVPWHTRLRIADFGLAREGPMDGRTHVSTVVMGTYGYAAPDYVETGHLTAKSDVWSFGVVLLEVLTGRRAFDRRRPRGEQKLVEWARRHPVDTRWFSRILDLRLAGGCSFTAAQDIAELAAGCLAERAKERPTMAEVVRRLKRAMQHVELDGPTEPPEEGSPPPAMPCLLRYVPQLVML